MPPRAPQLGPGARQLGQEREAYLQQRELLRHRSLMRGLFILAALVLGISFVRAGWHRVFFSGWWHHW